MKAAARLPALTNFLTLAVFVFTSSAYACPPPPQREVASARSLLSSPSSLPAAGGDPFYCRDSPIISCGETR